MEIFSNKRWNANDDFILGDQAAEHLHYGGIACYSCRAFFR